ncbi:hypothetical protein AUC68_09995 [Methyloceanibacter methanicus]|uniref:PTS EIIA type-2 domain-containing protein n=1 Tax=Methyloceanibacter methanicus TaxID=1774968 RepID=A0A1E3VWE6_9HYPH|nr:PTS sugar transporter subunit IIA [Methyloceanibacter methanicus]ODR97868.1 hypothetical protein AUC68_09995 [Methyloceanibacter methanicus]
MQIVDFLAPTDVVLGVRAADKHQLLRELSAQAAAGAGLDPDEVAMKLAKREELGSTGVGNGVALPHARIAGLKLPFGFLARLHQAIDFDAIDDQPVDIVFLLLLPETENGEQLNALACAARALRKPERLYSIRNAVDREAVYGAITAD